MPALAVARVIRGDPTGQTVTALCRFLDKVTCCWSMAIQYQRDSNAVYNATPGNGSQANFRQA